MRSTGLEEEGIYSVENLAFKLLRNSGQIGKLMSFQSDSYDKSLGYGQKNKIRVNIVRNMSEKKKKPKFHGVYYPAGGLQDSFGAPSDGDGSGE
jgi:DNA repair protein RadC